MLNRSPLNFFRGFLLPLQAAKLIFSRPRLLFWSALPVGITLIFYTFMIATLQRTLQDRLSTWLVGWGFDLTGIWAATVFVAVKIALVLLGAVTFSFFATIVTSPLNDFLAESSEAEIEPRLPPAPPHAATWRFRSRLIAIDLAKSMAAGLATLLALIVSWIPVLNLLGFALAALLTCFQYTSYPQTRRGVGVVAGVAFLFKNFWLCAGFGSALLLLFAIPWVSSFFLPPAVVGGTLLVALASESQ